MKRSIRRHHRERVIAKRVHQAVVHGFAERMADPARRGRLAGQSLYGECTCGICKRDRYRDIPRNKRISIQEA